MVIFRSTVMCYQGRNKDYVWKPTIPAGINRPPPSETILHVTRVPDHQTPSFSVFFFREGGGSSARRMLFLDEEMLSQFLPRKLSCLKIFQAIFPVQRLQRFMYVGVPLVHAIDGVIEPICEEKLQK